MKKWPLLLIPIISLSAATVPVLAEDLAAAAEAPPASSTAPFSTVTTSTGTDPAAVSKSAQATPASAATWSRAGGTVESVEATSSQFQLTDANGNSSRVTIGDNMVITRAGKKVNYADVQKGDSIVVTNSKPAPISQ